MTTRNHADAIAAIIERHYELERLKKIDEWAALFAEDCEVLFPFDTAPGSQDVHGREALVALTRQKFIDRVQTETELRVEPLADGHRALAHVHATITFQNGAVFSFPMLSVFTVNDAGLIIRIEEYLNEAFFAA